LNLLLNLSSSNKEEPESPDTIASGNNISGTAKSAFFYLNIHFLSSKMKEELDFNFLNGGFSGEAYRFDDSRRHCMVELTGSKCADTSLRRLRIFL
jgi:hypothetical protein